MNKKYLFIVALMLSLALNVALIFVLAGATGRANAAGQTQKVDTQVTAFTSLFIQKVLMADQDVDFNTRLQLETMVRNLNNPEILAQWQNFTAAKDNQSAGLEAKKLLDILVKNIAK